MSPDQISLVRKTWAMAEPLGDAVTTLFYGRLFELDPSVRSLFRNDMNDQGRSLRVMLSMVVTNLTQPDRLIPAMVACGRRHVNYRVEDRHYDLVGEALIWTLEQALLVNFNDAAREAWENIYATMANIMKEAAADEAAKNPVQSVPAKKC